MNRKKMLIAINAVAFGIAGVVSSAQAGGKDDHGYAKAELKSVRLDKVSVAHPTEKFLSLLL